MKRFLGWLGASLVVVSSFLSPAITHAQENRQDRGLFITPPRQYKTVEAGRVEKGELTVGNANDTSMKVTLSVEQFSVTDRTYNYLFTPSHDSWITLSENSLELNAKQSRKISYTITPPATATPGGHYFSIFASASLNDGKQIRTAIILYLTVGGELVRTLEVVRDTLPSVWVGGTLPLEYDVKNTGNTHFFIYASTKLKGWLTHQQTPEVAHILLPQTTRAIQSSLSPPILPGVYRVEYAFKTEDGQYKNKERHVIYLPIWSWAIAAGLVWIGIVLLLRAKRLAPWRR